MSNTSAVRLFPPSQLERHQRLFAPTPVCLRITWNSQHYLAGRCNTTPVSAVRRFHRNSWWRWRSSSLGNMMSQTGLTSAFDALNAASIHRYNAATDTETPRPDGRTYRQTDSRQTPDRRRLPPSFAAFPTLTPAGRRGEHWVVGLTSLYTFLSVSKKKKNEQRRRRPGSRDENYAANHALPAGSPPLPVRWATYKKRRGEKISVEPLEARTPRFRCRTGGKAVWKPRILSIKYHLSSIRSLAPIADASCSGIARDRDI